MLPRMDYRAVVQSLLIRSHELETLCDRILAFTSNPQLGVKPHDL
jgi:hypothetical protein